MNRETLPQPDDLGVYTFPEDLIQAYRAHQNALAARRRTGDASIIGVTAPHGQHPYLIEQRRPEGRPVVVIEPHHDDLALSASGTFLARPRPLTVVTVFTDTNSADRAVKARYPNRALVSDLRAQESRQALRPLGARHHLLGHVDAAPPYRPYARDDLDRVTADLEKVLTDLGDAEILAPAAVTRHPDHLLVHEAAKRLGCRWFWDDVAFWQTYALSVDDLYLFHKRSAGVLSGELTDITDALLDKLTLLYLHSSQLQPLHAMYRPIRYAWTTGSGLRSQKSPAAYAERFYRTVTS
ncbi:PIG-L family deacetylase [Sphaerisporangium sp. NPDC088356]|uniref:PIG-L deacetylase family protein n=1 Tax=Sphaerisporangium sp. NPDC088356 TaxID=3154871 RepID=UPI003423928C